VDVSFLAGFYRAAALVKGYQEDRPVGHRDVRLAFLYSKIFEDSQPVKALPKSLAEPSFLMSLRKSLYTK
jgi:hypothetical protein